MNPTPMSSHTLQSPSSLFAQPGAFERATKVVECAAGLCGGLALVNTDR